MRNLLILVLPFFSFVISAQKHDNVWLLGYGGGDQSPTNDSFGLTVLTFDINKVNITNNQSSNLNFHVSNSSMADSLGNLLFYSNAERVYNRNHQLMQNGNDLNITNEYGSAHPQGVLSLPYPSKPQRHIVLIMERKYFSEEAGFAGYKIYSNTIDVSLNTGLGSVVEKKIQMIEDTLEYGQMTAVKHANGRDWWLLIPETYTNKYYTMLINDEGVAIIDTQPIGYVYTKTGVGQAVFSPNGTKYFRISNENLTKPCQAYLYDFDRCTGKLSNPVHWTVENTGLGNGCAFSGDSRYLYVAGRTKIWQYDMQAPDVPASQTLVAEWDGYVHINLFITGFGLAQLAPDGRIYICTPNSNRYLHTIEFPDRPGAACKVWQRAIYLPNYNVYSIPNHPNFRLGPLDGSACDTLGLDNLPLANFRWDFEDTLSPLQVTFSDLSAYEPEEWHWDFGDGTASQDTSPVHTFPAESLYIVCLTVLNAYGADTLCYPVQIGTSVGTDAPEVVQETLPALKVYPNPANNRVVFTNLLRSSAQQQVELYSSTGQCIKIVPVTAGRNTLEINTGELPTGFYMYKVRTEGQQAVSGKINIVH